MRVMACLSLPAPMIFDIYLFAAQWLSGRPSSHTIADIMLIAVPSHPDSSITGFICRLVTPCVSPAIEWPMTHTPRTDSGYTTGFGEKRKATVTRFHHVQSNNGGEKEEQKKAKKVKASEVSMQYFNISGVNAFVSSRSWNPSLPFGIYSLLLTEIVSFSVFAKLIMVGKGAYRPRD